MAVNLGAKESLSIVVSSLLPLRNNHNKVDYLYCAALFNANFLPIRFNLASILALRFAGFTPTWAAAFWFKVFIGFMSLLQSVCV